MKKNVSLICVIFLSQIFTYGQSNIVEKYGKLQVKGNYIIGEKGDTVQLRGLSFFWSQWMGQYYNEEVVKWLRDDWKCTIVRAAMGVEMDGYLYDPEGEKQKLEKVVDGAIKHGIYVLIDFHSHEAHKHPEEAKKFFTEMAQKYGKYPNVIYELYNEPLQDPTWKEDIKPYEESIISTIRQYDSDNLIVCGTRQWSQLVAEAANDPIKDVNIAYSLHYYADTHKKSLRDEAQKALDKGVALFVTEFGTCNSSGNGRINKVESEKWWEFLDKNKISWCQWSVADKVETSSILQPGAPDKGGWTPEQITETGQFLKQELLKKNTPLVNFKPIKTSKVKK